MKTTNDGRGASASRPSVFSAPMSWGLAVKLFLLALVDGVALMAIPRMAHGRAWVGLTATIAVTLIVNWVFLSRRRIPAKYLLPGLLFLALFQIYPIGYTAYTAFTNYGTGNYISKSQAIERIVGQSREISDDSPRYSMALLRNPAGDLRLLLEDEAGRRFLATRTSFEPLDESTATIADGLVTAVGDYKRLNLKESISVGDDTIQKYVVKTKDVEIRPESLTSAAVSIQRYRYDKAHDTIIDNTNATVFRAKNGTFTAPDGTTVSPGFRANIGWRNYTRSLTNASLREAFLRVFAWNIGFALASIFLDSALGLLLAIVLNHPTMRFRRLYRSLLFLPYALPSIMMILVWSEGIFNTGYGALNRTLGLHVGWLDQQWTARFAILVVNMWLGYGYKLVLFSGQLQSIPGDLKEAAFVDGANGWQSFRHITLPLLLTGLAPMLISSFAYNFNNGGLVMAMTQGGPPIPGSTSVAGHTDILISYATKVAFSTGRGSDFGYACALSILIFFLVAAISIVSFRQTKQFEELA